MCQREPPERKGPTVTFSAKLPDGTVKMLELPAPTSTTEIKSVTLNPGEFETEDAVLDLMLDMFNHAEWRFQYFSLSKQPQKRAGNYRMGCCVGFTEENCSGSLSL